MHKLNGDGSLSPSGGEVVPTREAISSINFQRPQLLLVRFSAPVITPDIGPTRPKLHDVDRHDRFLSNAHNLDHLGKRTWPK